MDTGQDLYLTIWHRGTSGRTDLPLPQLAGADVGVEQIFPGPTSAPGGWTFEWTSGALRAANETGAPSARVLRLRRSA
jgi:hypothetical protein